MPEHICTLGEFLHVMELGVRVSALTHHLDVGILEEFEVLVDDSFDLI